MTVEHKIADQSRALQRAGDCVLPLSEVACSQLVALHGPMVKAACQRILRDAALAENAAQEVFLLFVRKLPSLPPQTILGGWLYVTACQLARTHHRTHARRWQRETQAMEYLMKPAQDILWRELEPLLDDAMLTLSQRQRELVLFRYFQNNSQRAAAGLVGCSESVASRELAAAIERLRIFFTRQGVTVSGTALVTLLAAHGAQASIGTTTVAATLSSASALAGASTAGTSLFLGLMKITTTSKIIAAAAALVIGLSTVHHLTRTDAPTAPAAPPKAEQKRAPATAGPDASPSTPDVVKVPARVAPQTLRSAAGLEKAKTVAGYDEAALKAAREKQDKFFRRMGELALMSEPLRVQDLLAREYGIHLSVDEITNLQKGGQKGFTFGLIDLWATKQPQDALAWVLETIGSDSRDLQRQILNAARNSLPNLNHDTLAEMLPEGPGKADLLNLVDAGTDPVSLANRTLALTDPSERASQLKSLAKGWDDPVAAAEWARQNLSGIEKSVFYEQVSYELAHKNPQTALQVLAELKGTDSYAPTFGSIMRGLVQIGGQGQQAAELIANANVTPRERADLISELARRWVRSDPDATIAWANTLTASEDFRAAIPLLVSQLDNERVSRTVESYLKNHDPVMELALIEAAAPTSLRFDPEKSRLILDPLISQDPALKLRASEGSGSNKEEMLWNSVNQTAKLQAENGSPAAAMEWLSKLPFASQGDYATSIANVLNVWNLKSPTEAATWLQNSSLNPTLKADLRKAVQP